MLMKVYSIRGAPSANRKPESLETARARLSKTLSKAQNWFDSARRLTFAMRQLQPSIAEFWCSLAREGTDREKAFPTPDVECISVHLMLGGLAIENLCKGYIVSRFSAEEKAQIDHGKLPQRLDQKHRLRRLLSETGISMSEAEDDLVTRMEDSVQWLGRYPGPKSLKIL